MTILAMKFLVLAADDDAGQENQIIRYCFNPDRLFGDLAWLQTKYGKDFCYNLFQTFYCKDQFVQKYYDGHEYHSGIKVTTK